MKETKITYDSLGTLSIVVGELINDDGEFVILRNEKQIIQVSKKLIILIVSEK